MDTAFDRIGGTTMAAGAGVLVLSATLIGAAILVWLLARGRGSLDEPLLLAIGFGLVLGRLLGGPSGGAIGANRGPVVVPKVHRTLSCRRWDNRSPRATCGSPISSGCTQCMPCRSR